MKKGESILQYYTATDRQVPQDLLSTKDSNSSHFNVLNRKQSLIALPYVRRDYFKICLCIGKAVLITDKGEVPIDKPAIFFSNPDREFGWKSITKDQEGYVCLFNEKYINAALKRELKQLSLAFSDAIYPFLFLDRMQEQMFLQLFKMMQDTYNSDYAEKHAMIHSALTLIVHQGIMIRQDQQRSHGRHPRGRLVDTFFELLNSQFPVDSPQTGINLTRPDDFARALHVHVNYLNHSLKKQTGHTTSQLIHERLITEASDLLVNSDWSVSEIGYSLGFEYPQHFNHIFKKITGKNPRSFRLDVNSGKKQLNT